MHLAVLTLFLLQGELALDVAAGISDVQQRDSALARISIRASINGDAATSELAFAAITSQVQALDTAVELAAVRKSGSGPTSYNRLTQSFQAVYENNDGGYVGRSFHGKLVKAGFLSQSKGSDRFAPPADLGEISFDAEPARMVQMFEKPPSQISREAELSSFGGIVLQRHDAVKVVSLISMLELDEESQQRLLAIIAVKSLFENKSVGRTIDLEVLTKPGAVRTTLEFLSALKSQISDSDVFPDRDLRREAFFTTTIPDSSTSKWWLSEAAFIEKMRGCHTEGLRIIGKADAAGMFKAKYDGYSETVTFHSESVLLAVSLCVEEARLGSVTTAVDHLLHLNAPDSIVESALEDIGQVSIANHELSESEPDFGEFSSQFVRANLLIGAMKTGTAPRHAKWSNLEWAYSLVTTCSYSSQLIDASAFERVQPSVAAVSQPPACQSALLGYLLRKNNTSGAIELLFQSRHVEQFALPVLEECLESTDPAIAILAAAAVLRDKGPNECKGLAERTLLHLSESTIPEVRYAALSSLVSVGVRNLAPLQILERPADDSDIRFLAFILRTPSLFDLAVFERGIESQNSWLTGITAAKSTILAKSDLDASRLVDQLIESPRNRLVLTQLYELLPEQDARRNNIREKLDLRK